ncbi:MAG: hypothetical protein SOY70_06960 [Veillonellaceae bacterium]|nr:hypothetical protein [Veillonellaceae bacterium]
MDATDKELDHMQKAWILNNEDTWHGFSHIEDDYVMLDPIKITIQTPGLKGDGTYKKEGIPAAIVTDYLIKQGVVVEKTDTYSFLLLHSFGTTEGKHGDLLAGLLAFKRDYDNNTLLMELFLDVVKNNPRFEGKGLYDLCHEMNEFYKKTDFLHTMQDAFDILPKQVMTPAEAYEKVVHRDIEYVYLDDMMGRIPAVMVVPYPPGIPVIMGGEKLDKEAQPIFKYLQLLQTYENTFKGYEKDIHGVERDVVDGKIKYKTYCIKK